ncbi:Peptidyl-prolyl isomerase cwc27 [Eufriesea mexicana]|uniref:Spliceosome-associated protein CWC27 homolog n=1 Tax=Eufriesea mexicana TaxID=516756 RepID=A0A310SFN4_9HYME|nr:Peptidyl-prolyl isomerase cwc27 [Eufriesea mexicana]
MSKGDKRRLTNMSNICIQAPPTTGEDEFHTRLRFCRRDLIAMANAGKDNNGFQFFFTLSSTPDLRNKHTIFGKVKGETTYNMLKLEEALVDENDRPLYSPRLMKTIILNNPFSDIILRIIVQESYNKTIVGDVDLELRVKETPKACRNFIQICMEGYYHDTILHRIIKGFITQGDDPTSVGEDGLRFCQRDLIAMANAGKDNNVKGETIYNMLKLEEALVDEIDRPLYSPRLMKTIILNNPFSDIIPGIIGQESEEVRDSSKTKTAVLKDFNFLSFGEEAEEEKEESVILNKKFNGNVLFLLHNTLTSLELEREPSDEDDERNLPMVNSALTLSKPNISEEFIFQTTQL